MDASTRTGERSGADARKPVVVGVDGSPAALRAVRWAVTEVIARPAPLRLVLVLPDIDKPAFRPGGGKHRAALGTLAAARRAALSHWSQAGVTEPLDLTDEVVWGQADRVLTTLSRDAAWVALGCADIGFFSHMVLGSTALAVSRDAYCPVALVRRAEIESGPVLVVVNAWYTAKPALLAGFRAARARGDAVVVARIWQGRTWTGAFHYGGRVPVVPDAQIAHTLRDFPTVTVRPVTVVGDAVETIAYMSAGASLIVIGHDVNRDHPERMAPVTRELIRHAPCPVLLMPDSPDAADRSARSARSSSLPLTR
ncbi:universal stress protein [Nocardia huaxiensis]|uniref:Universal stress protein n=1 Tax=Nocardia huaxiensis TaxID=2755382 RepID=A0A7D6VEY1_9NOCA|nr:universal stress protein [Nocardia huaxiensis]QLY28556.1 universal stress protein [Nocardia huaxiensis]